MSTLRIGLVSLLFVTACSSPAPAPAQQAPGQEPPATEEPPAEEPAEPYELFGDPLDTTLPKAGFAEIVADPAKFNRKEVLTSGTVRANCTKRGCWMEVRPDAERDGAGLTIRFKDYGFFVPLDSRGARVTMQAKVAVTVLTKGQVLELEAEGGTVTNKRPDGSAEVTELTAAGVEMRGRKKSK
ncbi:MAG: DUF4920 domain-containing protein [Labilithrix sp.]|nr:DUF4920 domain-containing protein [Labilithrix sp.]